MEPESNIPATLSGLMQVAPAGFAIALHLRFAHPIFMFQTYPKDWADEYSRDGLIAFDPTVTWGFSNSGHIDWRELEPLDEAGVMKRARERGLAHGVTISVLNGGSRSIGSFARSDRRYETSEVDMIEAEMRRLHDATASARSLPEDVREALHRLSVAFTHP